MYVVHTQSSLFSCVISLGELLGVEYLYSQTGKVLQDMGSYQSETDDGEKKPDEEEHGEEEDDDEGFGDIAHFVRLSGRLSSPFQAIFAIKIHQSAHQVLPRLQQILNGLTNHSTLSFGDRIDN